jgi:hypothetical protein
MSFVEISAVLGNVGEFIGAIAVLATLAYLAVQIKQNTTALRSGNAATVQINIQNLATSAILDREFSDILIRGMAEPMQLTPSERVALYAWFFNMLKNGELAFAHFSKGDLDEDYWQAYLNFLQSYWLTPGCKQYWADRKTAFVPAFQLAMEEWMADSASNVTRADVFYGSPS